MAFHQSSLRAVAASGLGLALMCAPVRDANALTMVLDFSSTATDVFGQRTGAFNATPYGFDTLLTLTEVTSAVLAAVEHHYLDYPTTSEDPLSPLPNSKILDINFVIGTYATGPGNGDSEWWTIKIGSGISGSAATNSSIYGQACLSCARTAGGAPNYYGLAYGSLIGSIFTDHIDDIAYQAANDNQLINLIAGTISHEIGHTLSLDHPGAQAANPGDSAWGLMGSGATSMPNSQRFLQREFTYTNFGLLMTSVGLDDVVVPADPVTVPEPNILHLLGLGLLALLAAGGKGGRRQPGTRLAPSF